MGTTTSRRRSAGRLAVAAVALLLVAGCGDDDDDAATDTTTAAAQTTAAPAAPADSPRAAVTVQGFAFDPAELTVAPGTTVTWTNEDGTDHTVVGGSGLSGQLAPGGTYEHRFDSIGTFTYACTIHPSMTGTVTVT